MKQEVTPAELEKFYQDSYFIEEHPGYTRDLLAQAKDPGSVQNILLDRIERFQALAGTNFLNVGAAAGVMLLAAKSRGAFPKANAPQKLRWRFPFYTELTDEQQTHVAAVVAALLPR